MSPRFALGLVALFGLLESGAGARPAAFETGPAANAMPDLLSKADTLDPPPPIVVFDMPHGACRLTILADGSARLFYAAMPEGLDVLPYTFNPDEVRVSFEAVAVRQSSKIQLAAPVGSVRFGQSDELFLFDDVSLARTQFAKALAHRVPNPVSDRSLAAEAVERHCAM